MSKLLVPKNSIENCAAVMNLPEKEITKRKKNCLNSFASPHTQQQMQQQQQRQHHRQQQRQQQCQQQRQQHNMQQQPQHHSQQHNQDLSSQQEDEFNSLKSTSTTTFDFDDYASTSSIMEFLKHEKESCSRNGSPKDYPNDIERDTESIFREINRLTDSSDTRSIGELLREAELLLERQNFNNGSKPAQTKKEIPITPQTSKAINGINMNSQYTRKIEMTKPPSLQSIKKLNVASNVKYSTTNPHTMSPADVFTPINHLQDVNIDNVLSESNISEESAPPGLHNNNTATNATSKDITTNEQLGSDTDDGTVTMEDITEHMENIELEIVPNDENSNKAATSSNHLRNNDKTLRNSDDNLNSIGRNNKLIANTELNSGRRSSCDNASPSTLNSHVRPGSGNLLASPLRRLLTNDQRNSIHFAYKSSNTSTPDSGVTSQTNFDASSPRYASPIACKSVGVGTVNGKYCDKSANCSPVHLISVPTSPIHPDRMSNTTLTSAVNMSREYALNQELEQLQERLKDTEERLESFRVQHDTLSQLHRQLREQNTNLQDQTEMLKLDVQHLNECANVLRSELKAARKDRDEALELHNVLKAELSEIKADKKRTQEQKDKDAKTIQDLQRQCREMERILMRKHPDSVSALIVASKAVGGDPSKLDHESSHSRQLLEQRIAQLESDAKEQDHKAQQILAKVQARFNSVQAKYETHIADLETQVLSLQEINAKLNEKIESQVRTLDYFVMKKAEQHYNNCTQTEEPFIRVVEPSQMKIKNRKVIVKTIGTQTIKVMRDSSTNTIGGATNQPLPNASNINNRTAAKSLSVRKSATNNTIASSTSKLPVSQLDVGPPTNQPIAASATSVPILSANRDPNQLLTTLRGMRIDLAIKNKSLQRLTRELDVCKKTVRKLQQDKEQESKTEKSQTSNNNNNNNNNNSPAGSRLPAYTETQILKEAQNKYKLLEADYKTLHDKRLQDLKCLQTAHEREITNCQETVRLLQQRLNESGEQNTTAVQKRRKLPIDYYALKAKVTSLERRHTEREERLHLLVEALSKGRLNSALEDLLADKHHPANQ